MVSHVGLLRASGKQAGIEIDTRMIIGEAADPDGGIPHGAALRRFATAVIKDHDDLDAARQALLDALGEKRTVQAAAIVADFDAINRVADATGIELDELTAHHDADLIENLGFERMRST